MELSEKFTILMKKAMTYAKYSYDYLKEENIETYTAIAYLEVAVAKFSACEAFYYSHLEELSNYLVDKIFERYDQYVFASLQNIRVGDNHWTSKEYLRLREAYESFFPSIDD